MSGFWTRSPTAFCQVVACSGGEDAPLICHEWRCPPFSSVWRTGLAAVTRKRGERPFVKREAVLPSKIEAIGSSLHARLRPPQAIEAGGLRDWGRNGLLACRNDWGNRFR